MWRELTRIPYQVDGVPIFGVGVLLAIVVAVAAISFALAVRRHGWTKQAFATLPFFAVLAAVIVVLPHTFDDGIPIRGYGIMLLVAIVAGVGLAIQRAKQVGLDPEVILSLALWFFIFGIVGARLFYVIEYWDRGMRRATWSETIVHVLKFSEGGLVVYGSLLGVLVALVLFARRYGLPTLALADLVLPSMVLGQAIGRIGCLLNGCCYGDVCQLPWAVTFPQGSPPYINQMERGLAHGLILPGDPDALPDVRAVAPDSPAERAGVEPHDRIARINGSPTKTAGDARTLLSFKNPEYEVEFASGKKATWKFPDTPPPASAPTHPAQIYSFLDAAILAAFLWVYYPFRRRDGEVIALALTIHPITRFLLEVIRVDEAPVFGTPFSISQNVSILILLGAAGLWVYLWKQPRGTAWPVAAQIELEPQRREGAKLRG